MPAASTSSPAVSSAPAAAPHVRRSWRALFDLEADAQRLAACWVAGPSERDKAPVCLHPRALGGVAVACRPGTTDAQVFDDTFVGLYHLPPATLPPDAVVVDLGGNVGYTAAHFAALCPQGRMFCVEMDPGNAAAARGNLAAFGGRCRVIEAAVWDRDGEIVYGGTEEWGFRIESLAGDTPTPLGERRLSARAMSMTTLLRESGLSGVQIDYLKVDIEGAEAVIIKAGAPWLKNVRMIKVEYHPPATRESMDEVLRHAGFVVSPDARHQRCVVGVRG